MGAEMAERESQRARPAHPVAMAERVKDRQTGVLGAEAVEGAEAKLEAPAATRPSSGKEPRRSRKAAKAVVEVGAVGAVRVETPPQ